jgi:hypothetical protein
VLDLDFAALKAKGGRQAHRLAAAVGKKLGLHQQTGAQEERGNKGKKREEKGKKRKRKEKEMEREGKEKEKEGEEKDREARRGKGERKGEGKGEQQCFCALSIQNRYTVRAPGIPVPPVTPQGLTPEALQPTSPATD